MAVAGDDQAKFSGTIAGAAATGLAAAAGLVLCETLKTARSSLWTPPQPEEIPWAAAAFALYAALGTLTALALALIAQILLRNRRPAPLAEAAAPLVLFAALYGAAAAAEAAATPAFGLSLAAFGAAHGAHRLLAARRALAAPHAVSLLWALAGAAGAAAAITAAEAFLIAPGRDAAVLAAAALAAAAAFAIGQTLRAAARAWRLAPSPALWRWPALATAAALALAALFAPRFAHQSHPVDPQRPPVILVTADTLRADAGALYGGPVPTPNLEAIAAENAALFEQAYVLAPWTLPSMFGLFASRIPPGLDPRATPDQWKEEITLYRMPKDVRTLAEILRERGYATGAFVANSLLHDPHGILRGFDAHIVTGHRTHTLRSPLRLTPFLESLAFAGRLPIVRPWPADTTRILTAQAQAFIRQNASRPFLLWVHYMDPHTAFAPPPQYAAPSWPWAVYCNADPYWRTPLTDDRGRVDLTEEQRLNVRALYDGEAEYVDAAVGTLWNALEAHGAAQRAYFAFTSDHGEEFWEHGAFGHGHSLYDELIRVPLLIRGPAIRNARIAGPVSLIDLTPTLADLAGVPADPAWQGGSLAQGLQGAAPLVASPAWARGTNAFAPQGPLEMVAAGKWKLIRDAANGNYALYDLHADPAEKQNRLAPGDPPPPDLDALLRQGMDRERRTVREVYDTQGGDDGAAELDAQMRGMGYIR